MSNIDCLLDVDPGLLTLSINDKLTTIDRFINAGVGLTGGGNLRDSDLTINAITPSTIDLTTVNDASIHTHEITTSSDPANTAAILSTDAAGLLTLLSLDVTWLTASDIQAGTADFTGVVTFASDIYSVPYVSQSTGWKITSTGNADFRDIYAESLSVRTFIADNVLATAGTEILTKSLGILAANFVVAASVDFVVFDLPGTPDIPVFSNGDTVSVRRIDRTVGLIVEDIIGTVSGYVNLAEGKQQWTLSVSSGTIGATVYEGATVLDWGVSGDGFILSTAVGVDPPYIDVRKWATTITNDTTYSRYGYLNGITGQDEYGLYSGISATQQIVASDQRIELRGAALSLYDGVTEVVKIDPLTLSIALGNPLPSFGNTGIWFGKHSGLYKARIGSATDYFLWDGSLLTVAGRLFVDDDSEFTGVVTIGSSGGIWQGTGTFASPTSGLKIWNDGGVGRIAGYNSGTIQAGFEGDGTLTAGGGVVVLDEDGIFMGYANNIDPSDPATSSLQSKIKWGSTNDIRSEIYTSTYLSSSSLFLTAREFDSTTVGSYIQIYALTNQDKIVFSTDDVYSNADTWISGNAVIAGGLRVGNNGGAATDDQIRLYRSTTFMGQFSTADSDWFRINQDVAKDIYTPRRFVAASGISSGATTDPGTGGLLYTGALIARRSGTNRTGYIYVPKTPPKYLWSATSIGTGIYTLTPTMMGTPSDAKAVHMQWGILATATGGRMRAGYNSSDPQDISCTIFHTTEYTRYGGIANTDASGNVYFKSDKASTGTGTYLWITGYWI